MPLDMSSLARGLAAIFKSWPSNGTEAASKIAEEYDKYCRKGKAPPGSPVFTGAEKPALASVLAGAIGAPGGSAAAAAAAFSSGIQAYWLSPPVPFVGGAASGVSSAMPGAAAIIGPLTGALSNLANSEEAIGQQIASQLDAATRTVLVIFATPTSGPPPPATVI